MVSGKPNGNGTVGGYGRPAEREVLTIGDDARLIALSNQRPNPPWTSRPAYSLPDVEALAPHVPAAIIVQLDGPVTDSQLRDWLISCKGIVGHPCVALFIDGSARHMHRAFMLAHAGADTMIIRGFDDIVASINSILPSDLEMAVATELTALGITVRPERWSALVYCFACISARHSIRSAELHAAIGMSERKRRRFAPSSSVPCKQFASAARLMCAAHSLDNGCTVERAAAQAGCCDSAALRHLMSRYELQTPSHLRAVKDSALSAAVRRFASLLS